MSTTSRWRSGPAHRGFLAMCMRVVVTTIRESAHRKIPEALAQVSAIERLL